MEFGNESSKFERTIEQCMFREESKQMYFYNFILQFSFYFRTFKFCVIITWIDIEHCTCFELPVSNCTRIELRQFLSRAIKIFNWNKNWKTSNYPHLLTLDRSRFLLTRGENASNSQTFSKHHLEHTTLLLVIYDKCPVINSFACSWVERRRRRKTRFRGYVWYGGA